MQRDGHGEKTQGVREEAPHRDTAGSKNVCKKGERASKCIFSMCRWSGVALAGLKRGEGCLGREG